MTDNQIGKWFELAGILLLGIQLVFNFVKSPVMVIPLMLGIALVYAGQHLRSSAPL